MGKPNMSYPNEKVTEGDSSPKQQEMSTGGRARLQGLAAIQKPPNLVIMATASITRLWANDG
jgi:hypothetical protein